MAHRQGAGMIRIADVIRGTTKVNPGKLSLGESEGGPVTRTLTIENESAQAVTYLLSEQSALASRNTYAPHAYYFSQNQVTFSAPPPTPCRGRTAPSSWPTSGNKVYTVPDGRYIVKLTVRKALGDDANPAHVETWTSPVITIDRP